MTRANELPDMVREAVDLSKEYLKQETLEPARRLGKVAGMSFAAGLSMALGALLLSVAVLRWLRQALPDGRAWTALGTLIASVLFLAVAAGIMAVAARPPSEPGPPEGGPPPPTPPEPPEPATTALERPAAVPAPERPPSRAIEPLAPEAPDVAAPEALDVAAPEALDVAAPEALDVAAPEAPDVSDVAAPAVPDVGGPEAPEAAAPGVVEAPGEEEKDA